MTAQEVVAEDTGPDERLDVGVHDVVGALSSHPSTIVGRSGLEPADNGVEKTLDVNDTAHLSVLLSGYLDQIESRMNVVAALRREAGSLGPEYAGEVLPLLEAVDHTVRQSDESTRVLLRWLESEHN